MGWFWDFWHWWTTARVAATAAAAAGTMAVVTGTTAVRSLRHGRQAAQRTTRPIMVASLKPSGTMSAGLEVSNVGPSMARNVDVTFDPPLPTHDTTPEGEPSLLVFVRHRFSRPVGAWPPGYVARSQFLILTGEKDDDGQPVNEDGIPRDQSIVFNYADDDGNAYNDRISLDPTLIEGENWTVTKRHRNGQEILIHDGAPWIQ
ncbi:hypothetical protein [Gordonia sp. KTR9]|uniref:hypothetical protein n=1 Tax=Gordonia sp. KTR9 TaxID=337191 RepID=UPI00027DE221|nr:hypothetical protein [Gordonia sp. KTR9]AFR48575.1 hypothetical protein KTR9_1936 [Gordonia sp. KTR9]